jgi:hypothetical protein
MAKTLRTALPLLLLLTVSCRFTVSKTTMLHMAISAILEVAAGADDAPSDTLLQHVSVNSQTSQETTFVLVTADDELPAPRFPAALTDQADTCGG